jgi:hypothetical protein
MLATTLLREQHRSLTSLIRRVADERGSRLPLMLCLVEELMTHLSIEDHFFLSTVADATAIRVESVREEQARVRNAVLQAVFVEEDEPTLDQRLAELSAAFERHTTKLEGDLLPRVEAELRGDDLETIGTRMQSFWEAALGRGADRSPTDGQVHAAE